MEKNAIVVLSTYTVTASAAAAAIKGLRPRARGVTLCCCYLWVMIKLVSLTRLNPQQVDGWVIGFTQQKQIR